MEVLCPTFTIFQATRTTEGKRKYYRYRSTIMDLAYLLGDVTDLRSVGMGYEATSAANTYFGVECMTEQCRRVLDVLVGSKELGYKSGSVAVSQMRRYLSLLFLLQHSPYLEEVTPALLTEAASVGTDPLRWAKTKMTVALQRLDILSAPPTKAPLAHGMRNEIA
jgi:hypothetical protein